MMDKLEKMKNGFTLVEIMVVVAIMMVLTGIGAVSLNKVNSSQELDGFKNQLVSDLNLARNMAITNQLPVAVVGPLKYVLVTIGNGSVKADAITEVVGEHLYFNKSNTLTMEDLSFGFSVENGRLTDANGVLVDGPLCLTLYLSPNTDDKKYIYIDTSGLIYEKDNCN